MGSSLSHSRAEAELDTLEFERRQCSEEEVERKQNNAMQYVTSNIFAYAPVKVRRTHRYIYIALDRAEVKLQEEQLKQLGKSEKEIAMGRPSHRGPDEVEIDRDGNIKLTHGGNSGLEARKDSLTGQVQQDVTYQEVCSNFVTPDPCAPPLKESSDTESITIQWEAPVIISKRVTHFKVDLYEVQYRPAEDDEIPAHAPYVAPGPFRTLTRSSHRQATLGRLDCAAAYVFRVRARNAFGWSDWSGETEVIQASADVPDSPQPPYPSIIRSTFVPMFWEPVIRFNGAPVNSYTMQMKEVGDATGESYRHVYTGTECSYVLSGLKPGCTYLFRVRALNSVGPSRYSEHSSVTTSKGQALGRMELPDAARALRDGANYWVEYVDEKRNQSFFFNKLTGERRDVRPEGFSPEEDDLEKAAAEEFRARRSSFIRRIRNQPVDEGISVTAVLNMHITRGKEAEDAKAQFESFPEEDLLLPLKVHFMGERGIDSGGLSKEFFLESSKQLCSKKLALFLPSGDEKLLTLNPNSGQFNKNHLEWLSFAGKLLAKALYERHTVEMKFATIIYKHILEQPILYDDLEEVDPSYCKSLTWMRENDITDILFETFSVEAKRGNKTVSVELVPGGKDKEVTDKNKEEYIALMVQWRTDLLIREQMDMLLDGFYSLVPFGSLAESDLSPKELDLIVNGRPEVNIDDVRPFATYQGGYDENSAVVLFLWQTLREFSDEYRGIFLKFVTGTSKVPVDGFDPPFTITKSDMESNALPKAHTCFNQLVLPEYASGKQLHEKLFFALMNTEGFQLT